MRSTTVCSYLVLLIAYFAPFLAADPLKKKSNRLIHEKSPYLLQHADDPIDWYPWGSEALEKAQKEDKPIFLSIGYSACHLCHLMQKESFEDSQIAARMNETFVSILVDREERPDIDRVYMNAYRLSAGAGGWPLNIIMTSDQQPFYMATYIPRSDDSANTGMLTLILRINQIWQQKRDAAIRAAATITAMLREEVKSNDQEPEQKLLHSAFEELKERFDAKHGGFHPAPKYPSTHELLFLLRYWKRTSNNTALEMVEKTLLHMRRGAIYDHVGFGFHRYCEDEAWRVPHFEKMLYDQAMHVLAYTEAYEATRKIEYRKTVSEVLSYVEREMTDPNGGFYSSEDADTEGEAGKFYLWTAKDVRAAVGEDANWIQRLYNVDENGNFPGQMDGKNILYLNDSHDAIANALNLRIVKLEHRLERARKKLFEFRSKKTHPLKDNKILTDWNGLMIAAFAKAAQVFNEPNYEKMARRAAEFVLSNLRRPDGTLFHRYREGHTGVPAYVDDYAFFIFGLIELYQTTFEVRYLQMAVELNQQLIDGYWDKKNGGFYFISERNDTLLVRPKEIYDGSIPSGNSIAMWNLLRLGRITGDRELEKKARQIAQTFYKTVEDAPSGYCQFAVALDFLLGPTYEVVIAGNSGSPDTKAMINALRSVFIPRTVVLMRPAEEDVPEIVKAAPFIKYQSARRGKATAYVCQNTVCLAPTTDINQMLRMLDSR
jgi:uncharacterized protein